MVKSIGHAELRGWMSRSGRNYADIARLLGVSRPHLVYLTTGKRSPSLNLALRINTLTGIPVAAWAKPSASKAIA